MLRKPISVLLTLVMLFSAFAGLRLFPQAKAYAVGDLIQFGTYPQSLVTDETLVSALSGVSKTWKSYRYYSNTIDPNSETNGTMEPGDWMRFADFFYGGAKYRAVVFDEYRPTGTGMVFGEMSKEQEENGFYTGTVYYFKYEPLTWRVLDPSTGYIMCETVVDAQSYQNYTVQANSSYYQNADHVYYANHYATSTIRTWLNADFYETAFSADQKDKIKTTQLDNSAYSAAYNSASSSDKIFMPSYSDMLNTDYGFSSSTSAHASRKTAATDYAGCQDANYSKGTVGWWLRSPGSSNGNAGEVYPSGYLDPYGTVTETRGIRPACCLSALADDTALSLYLYSQGTEHTHGNTVLANVREPSCADGYTGDHVCEICGTVLTPGEVIPAVSDHSYGDPTWTWADGHSSATATFVCEGCVLCYNYNINKNGGAICLNRNQKYLLRCRARCV